MKYLVVLMWPAGLALIVCIAALLARSETRAASAVRTGRAVPVPSAVRAGQRALRRASPWGGRIVELAAIVAVGALLVYGVMWLLGQLVVPHGGSIDRPIYHWTVEHRVHLWASVMKRLTKIGDTWTTWGAAGAAAVCLAVVRKDRKWLPVVTFIAVIVVDHYTTKALRGTFHRLGPPDSPLGTYPSGGCDRVIAFYGVIFYFLWRDFSGRRVTAIWAAAAVAALAFNEAYTRAYLTLHWFTDVLSGLLYGSLLLAVFIIALRVVETPVPTAEASAGWVEGAAGSGEALDQRTGYAAG